MANKFYQEGVQEEKSGYRDPGDKYTLRENAQRIFEGKQPDYYFDFMDTLVFVPDPDFVGNLPDQDGEEHKDRWGVTRVWLPGAPGAHPHITDENKVIKDIENWRDEVVFPPIEGLDWGPAIEVAESTNRKGYNVALFMAGGLFEMSHFLMGMEDAFCNYMEEPEIMEELLTAIAEWKMAYMEEAAKHIKIDVVFFQDDWGSKQNLFLPPSTWREMIKPLHTKIVAKAHELGWLFVHHADCICEPIAPDMVDMGIDIWQGVIAQNDIVAVQKATEGKLAMIGGIDGPKVDVDTVTDEEARAEVRRAVDTYCAAGRFYPGIPNGACFIERIDKAVKDELHNYGIQYAKEHPIA